MDWKALLNSKKTLYYGIPAAGALGLGVWYYRKKNGGSSSTGSAVTDTTAGGAVPSGSAAGSFPDTSGTDVATWLGSQEGSLQDILNQFVTESGQQQQDFLDKLGTSGTTTNPTTPVSTPTPTSNPVTRPPVNPPGVTPGGGGSKIGGPIAQPRQVTVTKFNSKNPAWSSTLSGIAAHEHTTVAMLEKLNGNVDPRKIQPGQAIKY